MAKKNSKRKSNYIVQGSILAAASIIVRIIGLVYRVPVTRILGPVGNSYYSAAYEVYSMMLLISSFSLPLAVSKLVSARMAKGRVKAAYKIFKCTLIFALISGGIASLLVFFGAGFFSKVVVNTPQSKLALQVLAPTILVVALMGCVRGYFQGLGSMVPTAVSQIVEQVVNAAVSIGAAWALFKYGTRLDALLSTGTAAYAYGAAGSTLGTGAGALTGLVFLLFIIFAYSRVMKKRRQMDKSDSVESTREIYYLLFVTIFPVILSTAVYNISGIIDQGVFKHLMVSKQYQSMRIDELWGIFSGEYKLLTNVPIAVASAMASSAIPALTRARVNKDRREMRRKTENAIRFVMVVCIPCAVGLSVLAEPVLTLLFGAKNHIQLSASLLQMGSASVVFYGMSTLTNGILQGMDKMRLPVIHAAVSLVLHVALLVLLILGANLNIYAVVWANIFFAFLMCVLNSRSIARYMRYRQEIVRTFLVPLAASAIMGAAAFGIHKGLMATVKSNTVATLSACAVAVVVYGISLLLLKGLKEEEILGFPKGYLVVKIAKKLHLM
ncbi:MAG TPA: polysaccharide biosynthesis protein [Lachnospiraceae bacterium]|nr:polysaccharide biosynthesis protein [Lachnospiraceae bacterium]